MLGADSSRLGNQLYKQRSAGIVVGKICGKGCGRSCLKEKETCECLEFVLGLLGIAGIDTWIVFEGRGTKFWH